MTDYLEQPPFGRTGFLSFERHSLARADTFEHYFREAGLAPWRYHPDGAVADTLLRSDSLAAQLERYRQQHPDEIGRLEATLRRCSAVVFLVSSESLRSAFCELEAWVAGIIHSYGAREHAAIYVILEEAGLEPPVFIRHFWRRTYEPGLEEAMAALLASEIDAQAAKIAIVEHHRQQKYR
jgi:hypothetical protein